MVMVLISIPEDTPHYFTFTIIAWPDMKYKKKKGLTWFDSLKLEATFLAQSEQVTKV